MRSTENLVSHWLGDRNLHGQEPWREAMANFFDAFPDAAYTFFAGDKGVWLGTWHATQRKEWEGIPATGRKAKWTVIIIGRFEGDKHAGILCSPLARFLGVAGSRRPCAFTRSVG